MHREWYNFLTAYEYTARITLLPTYYIVVNVQAAVYTELYGRHIYISYYAGTMKIYSLVMVIATSLICETVNSQLGK